LLVHTYTLVQVISSEVAEIISIWHVLS